MSGRTGKLITLEGIEGCGKSTQQKRLSQWLAGRGQDVVTSKEPGGTRIGAQIREILLHTDHEHMAPACEAMLYLADRAQHHAEVVKPALKRGAWVVCDRYHDSTLAYQGVARGLATDALNGMFAMATGSLQPDLTLLLDMSPEKGLARARARNQELAMAESEGRFEAEALQFHRDVRAAFLAMAQREKARFVVIDADREAEQVAASIQNIISTRWMVEHV